MTLYYIYIQTENIVNGVFTASQRRKYTKGRDCAEAIESSMIQLNFLPQNFSKGLINYINFCHAIQLFDIERSLGNPTGMMIQFSSFPISGKMIAGLQMPL